MNGRVDIMGKRNDKGVTKHDCRWIDGCPSPNQFDLYDRIPIKDNNGDYSNVLRGTWEHNLLSSTFFSNENITIIQNGIRAGVYKQSNHKFLIGPQDTDTLVIIMRSMFLQHATNRTDYIAQQVEALNKLVVDYAVPQIYGEAESYMKYKKDVSTLAIPLKRPGTQSMAGINTHPSKYGFENWFGNDHCTSKKSPALKELENNLYKYGNNREKEVETNWGKGKMLKYRASRLAKILENQRKYGLNTSCFNSELCSTYTGDGNTSLFGGKKIKLN